MLLRPHSGRSRPLGMEKRGPSSASSQPWRPRQRTAAVHAPSCTVDEVRPHLAGLLQAVRARTEVPPSFEACVQACPGLRMLHDQQPVLAALLWQDTLTEVGFAPPPKTAARLGTCAADVAGSTPQATSTVAEDRRPEEDDPAAAQTVIDDYNNLWGILLIPEMLKYPLCRPGYLPRAPPALTSSHPETAALKDLEGCISKMMPEYELHRIDASGGAANAFALLEASGYEPSQAAVACFSYLSGSNNWLSRSAIKVAEGQNREWLPLVGEEARQPTVHPTTKLRTIYLPYHAEPLLQAGEDRLVRQAERRALTHVESLLAAGHLKALLFEPTNCLTGFTLSPTFLQNLHTLLKKYGAVLVADEVLTSMRTCADMLQSKAKGILPEYVTLGKWAQAGLVLRLRSYELGDEASLRAFINANQGDTIAASIVSCRNTFVRLERMHAKRQLKAAIAATRARTEQWLKDSTPKEQHASLLVWGSGGLVFANVHAPRPQCARGRFLPLLSLAPPEKTAWKLTGVPGSAPSKICVDVTLIQHFRSMMLHVIDTCGE